MVGLDDTAEWVHIVLKREWRIDKYSLGYVRDWVRTSVAESVCFRISGMPHGAAKEAAKAIAHTFVEAHLNPL